MCAVWEIHQKVSLCDRHHAPRICVRSDARINASLFMQETELVATAQRPAQWISHNNVHSSIERKNNHSVKSQGQCMIELPAAPQGRRNAKLEEDVHELGRPMSSSLVTSMLTETTKAKFPGRTPPLNGVRSAHWHEVPEN